MWLPKDILAAIVLTAPKKQKNKQLPQDDWYSLMTTFKVLQEKEE